MKPAVDKIGWNDVFSPILLDIIVCFPITILMLFWWQLLSPSVNGKNRKEIDFRRKKCFMWFRSPISNLLLHPKVIIFTTFYKLLWFPRAQYKLYKISKLDSTYHHNSLSLASTKIMPTSYPNDTIVNKKDRGQMSHI